MARDKEMGRELETTGCAPVVFLDIDGVLNTTKAATHIRLEAPLVKRLKKLLEKTDANIILVRQPRAC